jgi:hypothetical protein
MQLPLTALVLRSGVTPASAFTESSRGAVDLQLWSAGNLERIEAGDVELTLTARADELVIALLDRPADHPAWQQFLNQALGTPFFTGSRRKFAHQTCARSADPWSANHLRRDAIPATVAALAKTTIYPTEQKVVYDEPLGPRSNW